MAINNRTLDDSIKRQVFQSDFAVLGTGITISALVVPYPSTLDAVRVAANGLSGSPTIDLRVWRFIVGTGVTSIAGGATTLTAQAIGTSGVQSMVLAASGNSLLTLLTNDVITLTTGGANTAASYVFAVVLKNTQDIRTTYGV